MPWSINDLFNRAMQREIQHAVGAVADAGNTTLIESPGPLERIVVRSFVLQNNSEDPLTMTLYDGSNAIVSVIGPYQGDGLAFVYPLGGEERLRENSALILNLSAALSCKYSIGYWTERT